MYAHPTNWYFGWLSILSGFLTGAGIGLFFHDDVFWGGYASFRRRIVRLGHVAQIALGMLNVLYGLSPGPPNDVPGNGTVASVAFVVGGLTMPAVCFLSGWRKSFRALFFVPVTALIVAVVAVLREGLS